MQLLSQKCLHIMTLAHTKNIVTYLLIAIYLYMVLYTFKKRTRLI